MLWKILLNRYYVGIHAYLIIVTLCKENSNFPTHQFSKKKNLACFMNIFLSTLSLVSSTILSYPFIHRFPKNNKTGTFWTPCMHKLPPHYCIFLRREYWPQCILGSCMSRTMDAQISGSYTYYKVTLVK